MTKRSKKPHSNIHVFPQKQRPLIPEIQLQGQNDKLYSQEAPISSAYPAIDNDLARDNIENDIPMADLQDI